MFSRNEQKRVQSIGLTGSVFEPDEGEGSDDLRAVSAYGLSKGLTSEIFAILFPWQIGN